MMIVMMLMMIRAAYRKQAVHRPYRTAQHNNNIYNRMLFGSHSVELTVEAWQLGLDGEAEVFLQLQIFLIQFFGCGAQRGIRKQTHTRNYK